MRAVVQRPGEGELIAGPSSVTIKATAEDTGGSFYLGEVLIQPGFAGPPAHVHERLHDMFYVLEGALTLRLGDETLELVPGSFACVPPGTVHTFSRRLGELHARSRWSARCWKPDSRGDRQDRVPLRLPPGLTHALRLTVALVRRIAHH
jgi:quercetin dioxygenase-like cupin family protein